MHVESAPSAESDEERALVGINAGNPGEKKCWEQREERPLSSGRYQYLRDRPTSVQMQCPPFGLRTHRSYVRLIFLIYKMANISIDFARLWEDKINTKKRQNHVLEIMAHPRA